MFTGGTIQMSNGDANLLKQKAATRLTQALEKPGALRFPLHLLIDLARGLTLDRLVWPLSILTIQVLPKASGHGKSSLLPTQTAKISRVQAYVWRKAIAPS